MQPPHVNGMMELSEEDKNSIISKIKTIKDGFTPTDDQPVCDTFYLVSTYNKQNVGTEINGDTAEFLLK
jgi:hypothetical protein